MRTRSRVFAVVLVGAALSTQASFAQDDAGSGAHADAKASDHPAAHVVAPGENVPDAANTRNDVQLLGARGKAGKSGDAKLKVPPVPKNPHRRTFSAMGSANRTIRNSIGVPIEQRDNKHLFSPVGSHVPVPMATSAARTPVGGVAKIEGQVSRPTNNGFRPVNPVAANHAVINGTGVHRVPNSSGIGGPSTAVNGISGTSIRPKH